MEHQSRATAPPFLVTVLFVGLTIPPAFTNSPVPTSTDATNPLDEQYQASAPSSDISDLSKSQHGNIIIDQNLQQPETDEMPQDNLQHQEGSQHSLPAKNLPSEADEEEAVMQNGFAMGNIETAKSPTDVVGTDNSSTEKSDTLHRQLENTTLSTNQNTAEAVPKTEITPIEPLELTTTRYEPESNKSSSSTTSLFLGSRHFPHDNMPFVTHLDGEVSTEQHNDNFHSEELELITPQPQAAILPSKLWYLDGTQHSNLHESIENLHPAIHEEEKLDNELLGPLDNPVLDHNHPITRSDETSLNTNETTENLGFNSLSVHQPDNDLDSDKTQLSSDFNANEFKTNFTQIHVTNHDSRSTLNLEIAQHENNYTVDGLHNTVTVAENKSISTDSIFPSNRNISTNEGRDISTAKTTNYNFTLIISDKATLLSNHTIRPTPTLAAVTNLSVTESNANNYHSKNYYDNVLISRYWEGEFEKHIQPEIILERSHNDHSNIAIVESPISLNTDSSSAKLENATQTETYTSLLPNLTSVTLEPSFLQNITPTTPIATTTAPTAATSNSSGAQTNPNLVTQASSKSEDENMEITERINTHGVVHDNQPHSLHNSSKLPSTSQLLTINTHKVDQIDSQSEPATDDLRCLSGNTSCVSRVTSISQRHPSSNKSTFPNMPSLQLTSISSTHGENPNNVNETDHYNMAPDLPIKPTKPASLHGDKSTVTAIKVINATHEHKVDAGTKQSGTTKNFTTEYSAKPSSDTFFNSTPILLSPPAVYILLVFNVPWITVCLHDKDLQVTLAEELTNLANRAIQPQQIVLLTINGALLNTQAEVCQDLEHSKTSPSLVVYVVDGKGEADQSLTTMLGNGLLHNEIKFEGTAFQNLVLEVRVYPAGSNPITQSETETNNYFGLVAAFTISGVAGTSLCLLCILLLILRHRHMKYRHHQQCRPVTDNYSLDSISIYSSFSRKRNSRRKRSYLNLGFNDSTVPSHQVNFAGLANVCLDHGTTLEEEFLLIPMKSSKLSDLPSGAEDKNRYANIIPIPETRVILSLKSGEPNSDYINANYVKFSQGHKGHGRMYIACQAPIENTVADFWRMVWEQQSKVIVMLTQFEEDNVPKCAQYFPESEFNSHKLCGDYQITLKNKEVLQNYTISMLQVRDLERNLLREVIHFWYTAWPPQGVPCEKWPVMAMLLEVRPHMFKNTGPAIIHCSTGTGRTGTIIAIDICMREFEECRMVDIPRCVSNIRKQRGGAVQNKEQYCFIYQVLNEYAIRLINPSLRSSFRSDTSTLKR